MATTITITEETHEKITKLGKKGETYNQLINRLADHYIKSYSLEDLI
jgi:predicted CopG family antitoxin